MACKKLHKIFMTFCEKKLLKQNAFLTYSLKFLRSNKLDQLEFKLFLRCRKIQEKLRNKIA